MKMNEKVDTPLPEAPNSGNNGRIVPAIDI